MSALLASDTQRFSSWCQIIAERLGPTTDRTALLETAEHMRRQDATIESLTSENTRLKREKCFWEAQSKVLSELIEDCEYAQCPCQPALMPLPPPPGDEQ